jgi:hypothetical protein
MPHAQHDPLIHKRLFHNLVFRHAEEYSRTTSVLASFSLASTSFDTTLTFIVLHPKSNSFFLFFLEDYEPNQDLELSSYYFKLTFQHMLNLSTSGLFGMVFEHLQDYFHPENSMNGFPQLFQLCSHVAQGHIPCQITHPWGNPPLSHDQAHRWNSPHYRKGSVILIHKPYFIPSISRSFCNTFLPTPIWSNKPKVEVKQ